MAGHALSREREELYSCSGWAADAAIVLGSIPPGFANRLRIRLERCRLQGRKGDVGLVENNADKENSGRRGIFFGVYKTVIQIARNGVDSKDERRLEIRRTKYTNMEIQVDNCL